MILTHNYKKKMDGKDQPSSSIPRYMSSAHIPQVITFVEFTYEVAIIRARAVIAAGVSNIVEGTVEQGLENMAYTMDNSYFNIPGKYTPDAYSVNDLGMDLFVGCTSASIVYGGSIVAQRMLPANLIEEINLDYSTIPFIYHGYQYAEEFVEELFEVFIYEFVSNNHLSTSVDFSTSGNLGEG